MKFQIAKTEFLRGLKLAQGIADRKSTMPILANVLLRTDGKGKLLAAATDLNVSVSAALTADVESEGGLTVSAKHLHDIVSSLPGENVSFTRTENQWATIRAGKVEYKLVGMADRDFPKMPDHREIAFGQVETAPLGELIDKTAFSVSNDETRFHLNGVLFESDGFVARMISTDGHRLSKAECSLAGAPVLAKGVIIPRKGLMEMKKALEAAGDGCEMAVTGPHLFLRTGQIALAVKLIDSQFPPYEQVIPKSNDKRVIIDRAVFMDALKRSQLMSSDTRGVRFAVETGLLKISSDNPELGELKEELEVDYQGPSIAVGFNPRYFTDLLLQMGSPKVALELSGELDPGVLRPSDSPNYLGVIMPMRI